MKFKIPPKSVSKCGKTAFFSQRDTERRVFTHHRQSFTPRTRQRKICWSLVLRKFSFFSFFSSVCFITKKKRSFNQKMFSLSNSLVPVARPTTTTVSLRKSNNTKVRFVFCALLPFSFLLSFLSARVVSRPARGPSSLVKTSSSSSKHPIL